MVGPEEPRTLVHRDPAAVPVPAEPSSDADVIEKLAVLAGSLMRQAHEQSMTAMREQARIQMEARTLDINRRFWLAVALGLGFLGVAVVFIVRGEGRTPPTSSSAAWASSRPS
jgi:hypothetical protein